MDAAANESFRRVVAEPKSGRSCNPSSDSAARKAPTTTRLPSLHRSGDSLKQGRIIPTVAGEFEQGREEKQVPCF
ncbi:unnamed protein product [Linum trigynum]|uniref:Uncharacterized protein n=1 Tax=Linum trigynum TaxID=586398 RepID=A0AAV2FC37_9ROSI